MKSPAATSPAPLVIRHARILTLGEGDLPRRGRELRDLQVIPSGDVLVEDGHIRSVGTGLAAPAGAVEIDAAGRVLMPGFVDCHTHACWAGDRIGEWEQKLDGVPYLEILKAGGGIHATVRAVRAASQDQLAGNLSDRLARMLHDGTMTVEVKSGYGLLPDEELKMLHAIRQAAAHWPGVVKPTALLGHAYEGDFDEFVRMTVEETLPRLRPEFPGLTIDAFCEDGAWTAEACLRLFTEGRRLGHPFRVHLDQFHRYGLFQEAIRLEADSVDHLEATPAEDFQLLAGRRTFGVILPCSGFHTDGRYANGRALVDAGGAIALATNCNPGSAPGHSMPFAISLAVRHCGLTAAEAIAACTANAAILLHRPKAGRIRAGAKADLLLLHHRDERALAYETGGDPLARVICGGRVVR